MTQKTKYVSTAPGCHVILICLERVNTGPKTTKRSTRNNKVKRLRKKGQGNIKSRTKITKKEKTGNM